MAGIMGKFKSILKTPEEEVSYDDEYYDDTEAVDADGQEEETDYDEPEEQAPQQPAQHDGGRVCDYAKHRSILPLYRNGSGESIEYRV